MEVRFETGGRERERERERERDGDETVEQVPSLILPSSFHFFLIPFSFLRGREGWLVGR